MLYFTLQFLVAISSHVVIADEPQVPESSEAPYQEVILREDIFKDRPKTTWMNCNFHADIQRCTWTLGPLGKILTSDDPDESLARHTVEMGNTSSNCLLKIDDINFGDEGFYECSMDDQPAKFRWHLVIRGDPGPPIISYANGTPIWNEMIAIDETPVTIHLRCLSTGAKPKHKKMYWLIDGNATVQSKTQFTGPIAGLWEASNQISISFDEDDEIESRVTRVTCVTDHATNRRQTTKVFGIRNTNDSVHLVQYEYPNSDRGQLKCETDVFPAPSKFEIVRLMNHPYQGDPTHYGQLMYVKHDGRYVCRAGIEMYRSSAEEIIEYIWLNDSNMIEIGDDTEYLESAAHSSLTIIGQLWNILLGVYAVTVTILILNNYRPVVI